MINIFRYIYIYSCLKWDFVFFVVGFCGIIGVFASVWSKTTDGIAMASEYLFLIDSDRWIGWF